MAGILGIACFVWTLLYKMLFVNIEASYQWLVPLGDVFYAVALSVIASVIFYYFTSFIPNYRSKKTIDKLLLKWLQQLDWYGKQMVGDISQLNYAEASKKSLGAIVIRSFQLNLSWVRYTFLGLTLAIGLNTLITASRWRIHISRNAFNIRTNCQSRYWKF
ncbi:MULTISPECIES: hypothetical protein [unclassified Bacteroides]|uniref:hypothetical protein n=1 Tax=unclassified Bacteroides TaxID=2646097 RepID=UPI0034A135E1